MPAVTIEKQDNTQVKTVIFKCGLITATSHMFVHPSQPLQLFYTFFYKSASFYRTEHGEEPFLSTRQM